MFSICGEGKLRDPKKYSYLFSNPNEYEEILNSSEYNKITNCILKEYEHVLKTKGLEASYRWSSFVFAGFSEKELIDYSLKVWKSENEKKKIYPFPQMLELLQFLKVNDWEIYIVTASPTISIKAVSMEFGIPPENVIGMNLKMDGAVTTPEIIEPYTYGEGKVKAFYTKTNQNPDLSFGDTVNDIPMLKSSKKAIMLDRKKYPELIETCNSLGIPTYPIFS